MTLNNELLYFRAVLSLSSINQYLKKNRKIVNDFPSSLVIFSIFLKNRCIWSVCLSRYIEILNKNSIRPVDIYF